MKRVVSLLLLLPLLGGCLRGVPLDRYCYVLDLGVERGATMPYRFVFLLNEDTAGSGEDGGGRGQVSMVSAEERSLFAAIDALSGACPPSSPSSGPRSWPSPGSSPRRGRWGLSRRVL